MKTKEESSFLQGVESRLDSLFAEDTKSVIDSDPGYPQAAAKEVAAEPKEAIREISTSKETSSKSEVPSGQIQAQDKPSLVKEVAAELKEDFREIPIIKETSRKSEVPSDQTQTQDKSSFINEIEKRFSAIFGEEDKGGSAVTETEKPDDMKNIIVEAKQEESKNVDQTLDVLPSPMSTILHSPLKDMKSIVLSIEWEINDQILEQFEEEINKLYLLYTGDRIIQGFLRILRFLGRYIRVRGVHSNQDSINLLLTVYDHLENVMVSEGMTEAKKHIILIDNIKKYRSWVESTDLETLGETEVAEVKPLEAELFEDKSIKGTEVEVKPSADTKGAEEKPFAETAIDKALHEDKSEYIIKEPDILIQTKSTQIAEIPMPAHSKEVKIAMAAMKDMSPHEAFAYALEELKKTFRAELDALKEEIRILKNAR